MSNNKGAGAVTSTMPRRDPRPAYDRARHGIHNLRRPEIIANPLRYWDAISELPPLFYDQVGGVWVCSGYQESVDILANFRAFSSCRYHAVGELAKRGMKHLVPIADVLSLQLLFSDPPEHTRLRDALKDEFTQAAVARREPVMQQIVADLLAGLPGSGTIDLVQDFAEKLPARLMSHLLGIEDRAGELTMWARAYEHVLGSLSTFPGGADTAAVPLVTEALTALRKLAEERLKAPREDLITTLASGLRDDPDPLTSVAANTLVLAGGGYQTLTHLVSTALLLLQRNPHQLRRLRADPGLIDSTIAEVMRIDGSSQYVGRRAICDAQVGEALIHAGESVLILLGAANLDARKFSDATRFDIGRSEGRHLGFGSGPHYCLGAPFAEHLAARAITGFLDRYQHYAPVPGDGSEWGPHANTRSLARALVTVARDRGNAPAPDPESIGDLARHQILAEWNEADTGSSAPLCWHVLFERRARIAPGDIAIEEEGVAHSYGKIDTRANALAHLLRMRGVEPEKVVAICAERSAQMIIAMLAVAKAGGAFLLASADCPGERLRAMLDEAAVRLVLADDTTADRLAALRLAAEMLRPDAAASAAEPPVSGVTPYSTAYVVFTSGTTGRPKAIATDHSALANLHTAQRRVFRLRPADRVLQFLSLNFDGCVSEIMLALLSGATLVVARTARLTPGRPLARLLREREVTVAIMTPSVWSVMPNDPLPALRLAAFAGERLRTGLARRWFSPGRRLLNLYGPAEAAIWTTWHECSSNDDPDAADVPIGRPIAGKRVYLLDDRRQLLPAGRAGELYIGGAGLGRYLGRPDLMAEAFMPDPFSARPGTLLYRTGDICVWRPDGVLEFRGRRDRQVKIRGQRVELDEVERTLEQAPGVESCEVFEREGRLEAAVVTRPGQRWCEADVRSHLGQRLHSAMIPARFAVTGGIGLTGNGKRATVLRPEPVPVHDRENSLITWQIALLYASCLRIAQAEVKLDTDFFSAGGDSLAMAEFLTALETRFGVQFDTERLLADPTLAGLVRLVSEQGH